MRYAGFAERGGNTTASAMQMRCGCVPNKWRSLRAVKYHRNRLPSSPLSRLPLQPDPLRSTPPAHKKKANTPCVCCFSPQLLLPCRPRPHCTSPLCAAVEAETQLWPVPSPPLAGCSPGGGQERAETDINPPPGATEGGPQTSQRGRSVWLQLNRAHRAIDGDPRCRRSGRKGIYPASKERYMEGKYVLAYVQVFFSNVQPS